MAKIFRKTHNRYVLCAVTHSLTLSRARIGNLCLRHLWHLLTYSYLLTANGRKDPLKSRFKMGVGHAINHRIEGGVHMGQE